jgi:hypothetical protein
MYLNERKAGLQRKISPSMFFAALFITVKRK